MYVTNGTTQHHIYVEIKRRWIVCHHMKQIPQPDTQTWNKCPMYLLTGERINVEVEFVVISYLYLAGSWYDKSIKYPLSVCSGSRPHQSPDS